MPPALLAALTRATTPAPASHPAPEGFVGCRVPQGCEELRCVSRAGLGTPPESRPQQRTNGAVYSTEIGLVRSELGGEHTLWSRCSEERAAEQE